jgi:hypothetical protein
MFNESGIYVMAIDEILGCKAYFDGKEFEL